MGEEIVRLAQDGADWQVWAMGLSLVGPALRRRGELQAAQESLEEYVALSDSIPDFLNRVAAGVELGQCHLDRGDLERGLREIQTSLRLSIEHQVRGGRFLGLMQLGPARAYLRMAERGPEDQRGSALRQARVAAHTAVRIVKTYRPWQAEVERLQGTYEWLTQHRGAAQRWWQRSLDSAKALGQRYHQALTHLEMGQRVGDVGHIARGEALLAEIGAKASE